MPRFGKSSAEQLVIAAVQADDGPARGRAVPDPKYRATLRANLPKGKKVACRADA